MAILRRLWWGGKRNERRDGPLLVARRCEEVRVERIKQAMKNEGLSRDECARTKVQAQPSASARCKLQVVGWGVGERGRKAVQGGRGRQGRE